MHRIKIAALSATLVAIALAGCAVTPSRDALTVHDADAAMVSQCAFVGDVTGTSAALALGSANRIESAKDDARTQAAKLGATDVVWSPVRLHLGTFVANGNAYRCSKVAAAGAGNH
ncbi:MAG: hypothetical protein OJF55_001175 [Rhodanobacteraceae bacterium]|jgi:hypothetical protein|nr:MAG: hypothetical protein OJF55_001175 [Rhodanobacteraceae bacterium]